MFFCSVISFNRLNKPWFCNLDTLNCKITTNSAYFWTANNPAVALDLRFKKKKKICHLYLQTPDENQTERVSSLAHSNWASFACCTSPCGSLYPYSLRSDLNIKAKVCLELPTWTFSVIHITNCFHIFDLFAYFFAFFVACACSFLRCFCCLSLNMSMCIIHFSQLHEE